MDVPLASSWFCEDLTFSGRTGELDSTLGTAVRKANGHLIRGPILREVIQDELEPDLLLVVFEKFLYKLGGAGHCRDRRRSWSFGARRPAGFAGQGGD